MPDYLLIRAQSAAAAVDILAVAAEIAEKMGEDAQVDIATAEEYADYLRLSETVRRVVGVAVPEVGNLALPTTDSDGDGGGGLGGKLLSFGKKMASAAGQNARQYWEIAKELRLVRYDAVFDFDSSAFSVAVARAAKADKIIGFDARNIEKPVAGASLLYSEVYHISADMSNAMRLRHLPARFFDYHVGKEIDCGIPATPSLSDKSDNAPYIAVVGAVPPPFAAILQGLNQGLLVRMANEQGQTDNARDLSSFVQHATFVVGNGVAAAIAAACGVSTLFIGGKRDVPLGAVCVSTPAELAAACATHLPSPTPLQDAPDASSAPSKPQVADAVKEAGVVDVAGAAESAAESQPSEDEKKPPQNALLSKIKAE